MEIFAIALIVLTAVILIIGLSYIMITTRHKEKMALLDKGLDPKEYLNDRYASNILKAGMLLLGIGIGFLTAFSFDEFIMPNNENPAIYPGMILIFGGVSQILFYKTYKKK